MEGGISLSLPCASLLPICQHSLESIRGTHFESGNWLYITSQNTLLHQPFYCVTWLQVNCTLSGTQKAGEAQIVEKQGTLQNTLKREGSCVKTVCPPQDISFYTHSSLKTSSPALQRPTPWTLENGMPNTPSSCLCAQSSTSGEPKACLNPYGPSNNVGSRPAESAEGCHDYLFIYFAF